MTKQRPARSLFVASVIAAAATFTAIRSVAAECTGIDPWPSFTEAARSAKRIVVGQVVESYADDSADNAVEFRVRVDEVLRGKSPGVLDFRGGTKSGAPLTICPRDSILRVRVGDVLAFAFDGRVAGSPKPVLAVAWVRGRPDPFLMPGAETLTLATVREMAALPMTDTIGPPTHGAGTELHALPLLVGILSMLLVLARPRRRNV